MRIGSFCKVEVCFLQPWYADCTLKFQRWAVAMLVGAILAVLLIFGLFLSMLSSSPKGDPDTDV